MTNPMDKFVALEPCVDDVREEAARCAEETAKADRGERGPLRMDMNPLYSEFNGVAAGVAAELAMAVMQSFKDQGIRLTSDQYWDTAAMLLRAGWQRGQVLKPVVVGEGIPC